MHMAGWSTSYRTLNRSRSKGVEARRAAQGNLQSAFLVVRALPILSEGSSATRSSASPHPHGTRTAINVSVRKNVPRLAPTCAWETGARETG